jgi:hypothetical protein
LAASYNWVRPLLMDIANVKSGLKDYNHGYETQSMLRRTLEIFYCKTPIPKA